MALSKNHINLLNLLCLSLFDKNTFNFDNNFNILNILSEAKAQTVFPLVYNAISEEYDLSRYQSDYYSVIANNVKIAEEHKTLHKLLCEADIEYVFLKGYASARYYPDPLLRTMGDVDLLVSEGDFAKTSELFTKNGYISCGDENGLHIAFKSPNGIKIELHRGLNGIPKGAIGERISALMDDILEKSVLENDAYYRPCDFHHGIVLLLHTASHIKNEGIGLRHLCDWAVFVAAFSDADFCNLFEKSLKEAGLWKFARILTQFAIKYLGCPKKDWVGEIDEVLLQEILNDVLEGGNFGKKDYSRYQHIKYIADRENSTIANDGVIKRLWRNTAAKAKNITFIKKVPFLLPFGIIAVILKYLWLIVAGKRRLDNKQLITKAAERKKIYNEFELYK